MKPNTLNLFFFLLILTSCQPTPIKEYNEKGELIRSGQVSWWSKQKEGKWTTFMSDIIIEKYYEKDTLKAKKIYEPNWELVRHQDLVKGIEISYRFYPDSINYPDSLLAKKEMITRFKPYHPHDRHGISEDFAILKTGERIKVYECMYENGSKVYNKHIRQDGSLASLGWFGTDQMDPDSTIYFYPNGKKEKCVGCYGRFVENRYDENGRVVVVGEEE